MYDFPKVKLYLVEFFKLSVYIDIYIYGKYWYVYDDDNNDDDRDDIGRTCACKHA